MSLLGFDAIGIWRSGSLPISNVAQTPAALTTFVDIFNRAARQKHGARWIAFAGNLNVETLPVSSVFSNFDPPAKPHHLPNVDHAIRKHQRRHAPIESFSFLPFAAGLQPQKLRQRLGGLFRQWRTRISRVSGSISCRSRGARGKAVRLQHAPQWWTTSSRRSSFRGAIRIWRTCRRHHLVYEQSYYDARRREQEHRGKRRTKPKTPTF